MEWLAEFEKLARSRFSTEESNLLMGDILSILNSENEFQETQVISE
jgi:hypothetical protein